MRGDRGAGIKWRDISYWTDNPENMKNIAYWIYTKAEPYPSDNSFYIDDKYMILVLERDVFYKNRELMLNKLDWGG